MIDHLVLLYVVSKVEGAWQLSATYLTFLWDWSTRAGRVSEQGDLFLILVAERAGHALVQSFQSKHFTTEVKLFTRTQAVLGLLFLP